MNRADSVVVPEVHLDLNMGNKLLDDSVVSNPAGGVEGGHSVPVRQVRVGVVLEQDGDNVLVILGGDPVHRGVVVIAIRDVHRCIVVAEHLDNAGISSGASPVSHRISENAKRDC